MPSQPPTRRGRTQQATLGLERTLPLTRLPAIIASEEERDDVAVLDDLPLSQFSPSLIDKVLRPAIDEIVETVVNELDEWFGAPLRGGALEHNIRAAADDALRQFASAVASGRPQLDRSLFRELGRKHARAGFPLNELVALFNRGGLACWRSVLQLHRTGALTDELLEPASEIVFAVTQELCSAAVEGYTEALSSSGTAVRSQRVEFVRQLVNGELPELTEAQNKARAVDWEVPERLAVAVTASSNGLPVDVAWPDEVLSALHGAQWCLLLPVRDGVLSEPPPPDGGTMAVGPAVPWNEARKSLEAAEDLLRLSVDGVLPEHRVLRAGEFGPELLLSREPALAQELIRTYLGPLLEVPEHRRTPLIETVSAWVRRPGQHTALAEELHVSVRTVRYRMDRLRELLGGIVDDPGCRLGLALAVRALECHDQSEVIVLDSVAPVEPVRR